MSTLWLVTKDTFKHWRASNPARLGASLSYYAIFSLAPLFIFLITIAGLFFGNELAQGNLLDTFGALLGHESQTFLQDVIVKMNEPRQGVVPLLVGFFTLLFGALGVLGELNNALDEIWRVLPRSENNKVQVKRWSKLRRLLKEKLLAISIIPLLGILLITSILASLALQVVGDTLSLYLPQIVTLLQIVEPFVSFTLLTTLFYTVFRILPDTKLPRRYIVLGSAVTALLFILGEFLIGLYLDAFGGQSVFGAAGSLIAILVWVYYSAQIFFIGASFTFVFANRSQQKK